MANKLTIVYSGRKQAGKSSAAKFTFCEFVNKKIGKKRFGLDISGKDVLVIDHYNSNKPLLVDYPSDETNRIFDTYSVKMYSFADPLKEFCVNTFGMDKIQCYGSDEDKDSSTHISWDSFPAEIREKNSRPRRGSGGIKPATGYMTARNVMQVFGTEVCRQIDPNCWARSLYNKIENDGYELAIVSDARFPNEITIGTENGAKVIRLLRKISDDPHPSEHALDDFPLGEFTLVIDNQEMSMEETHKNIRHNVYSWFERYKI